MMYRKLDLYLLMFALLTMSACSHAQVAASRLPADTAASGSSAAPSAEATSGPKYAPTTTPLSQDHAYLQSNPAPDFWKLISFYVPQEEHACSAASIAMVLNAFLSGQARTASDENVRQLPLIEKVDNQSWKAAIASGKCLNLAPLAEIVRAALKAYGFERATVEVVHVEALDTKTRARIIRMFEQSEKSANDFIIANFIQGAVTGDPEAMDAGHVSPIGAYDAVRKRVLILDVDRQYYEPYWAPIEKLLEGMNTIAKGPGGRGRGFMRINLGQ